VKRTRQARATAGLLGASVLAAVAGDGLWSEPFGQFALLPRPRQLRVTPVYTYSRAEHYYDSAGRLIALPDPATQNTGQFLTEYAWRPNVAADLTLGAVATQGPTPNAFGLTATQFGLRWRLLDEDLKESEPYVPTFTLRLGGIVPGTGAAPRFPAPGQGASGLETRALMSDTIGETGFSLYGDFGWRWLANGVPQQFFGSAGVGYALKLDGAIRSTTVNLGYAFDRSVSGDDLTALPPADWAGVKSLRRTIQAGLALEDRRGRRYQLFANADVEGRNAGRQLTLGAYVRFPCQPFPRRAED
jgi:hypothetical protein